MHQASTKSFPTSGIESNPGPQTFFLPRVFQVLGICHAFLNEDMKPHSIASEALTGAVPTRQHTAWMWDVLQCPAAGLHGKSVDTSFSAHILIHEHSRTPPTSSPGLLSRASRLGNRPNRSPSRDTTRLELVAVCRSDLDDAYTPPRHAELRLRQPAYQSTFYHGRSLARFWPHCQIGALTTGKRVSCIQATLGCGLQLPHCSPHKTPTLQP